MQLLPSAGKDIFRTQKRKGVNLFIKKKKTSENSSKKILRDRRINSSENINKLANTTQSSIEISGNVQPKRFDDFISPYSELIYDLCKTILINDLLTTTTFKKIWKSLQSKWEQKEQFRRYSRAWTLNIATHEIRSSAKSAESKLSASEQIMLDSTLNTNARLEQFSAYFHRLTTDEQLLLCLKDKYGFPLSEVSIILAYPENTLKQQRQAVYRTLEDWIWKN